MRRTVLIVDDHPPFRAAARAVLEAEGFGVVGEAGDAMTALLACARLRPQVVLLDVQLPGPDGFAAAEMLAALEREGPAPDIVLISSRARSGYRERLRTCPALGFLTKAELSGDALRALLDAGR
ncbi:response regulator transcription factor [Streptomyces sp. NPDC047043]|uniref:response regulator n=1 Tax=Streptomyces sp. NPDC047043 TaxID=3154497 RepID=UPI0033C01F3D